MANRMPEVAGDIDEKDWPEALNRALERGRQLDAQMVREREETAARIGVLLKKLGGEATITGAELAASLGFYTQHLDDGSIKLTTG